MVDSEDDLIGASAVITLRVQRESMVVGDRYFCTIDEIPSLGDIYVDADVLKRLCVNDPPRS